MFVDVLTVIKLFAKVVEDVVERHRIICQNAQELRLLQSNLDQINKLFSSYNTSLLSDSQKEQLEVVANNIINVIYKSDAPKKDKKNFFSRLVKAKPVNVFENNFFSAREVEKDLVKVNQQLSVQIGLLNALTTAFNADLITKSELSSQRRQVDLAKTVAAAATATVKSVADKTRADRKSEEFQRLNHEKIGYSSYFTKKIPASLSKPYSDFVRQLSMARKKADMTQWLSLWQKLDDFIKDKFSKEQHVEGDAAFFALKAMVEIELFMVDKIQNDVLLNTLDDVEERRSRLEGSLVFEILDSIRKYLKHPYEKEECVAGRAKEVFKNLLIILERLQYDKFAALEANQEISHKIPLFYLIKIAKFLKLDKKEKLLSLLEGKDDKYINDIKNDARLSFQYAKFLLKLATEESLGGDDQKEKILLKEQYLAEAFELLTAVEVSEDKKAPWLALCFSQMSKTQQGIICSKGGRPPKTLSELAAAGNLKAIYLLIDQEMTRLNAEDAKPKVLSYSAGSVRSSVNSGVFIEADLWYRNPGEVKKFALNFAKFLGYSSAATEQNKPHIYALLEIIRLANDFCNSTDESAFSIEKAMNKVREIFATLRQEVFFSKERAIAVVEAETLLFEFAKVIFKGAGTSQDKLETLIEDLNNTRQSGAYRKNSRSHLNSFVGFFSSRGSKEFLIDNSARSSRVSSMLSVEGDSRSSSISFVPHKL